MNTIIVEQLSYHYGQRVAVKGISFNIAAGEVLGFLGPNGAGKTTTVKMLTGQLRPDSGTIQILGLDVVKQTEAVQAQIGVAFEAANLYEQMSAVENLVLFARLFGIKNFDPFVLLDKVGLGGRGHDRVATYSKGMKQRLMLARALVNTPRILFLDEPTDGLDPVSALAIHELMREASTQGTTIFLTTHDMVEADKLADRVAFIDQGQIVALDTPQNLKQQFGRRAVRAEVRRNGGTAVHEVLLDRSETAAELAALFASEQVISVHSTEASLADIFVQLTGRGLV